MIDGASPIDPLVAQGPLLAVENLRPLVNMQRVLMLDGPTPMMADLATGAIRMWENGPPLSVPMVSLPFSLVDVSHLQIQVLRDPRPTSTDSTLVSLNIGYGRVIDVVETTAGELAIRSDTNELASGPIGASLAVVVTFEPDPENSRLCAKARNAETLASIEGEVTLSNFDSMSLTIGGPSTELTRRYGRRRLIPAHLDVARVEPSVGQVRRATSWARRKAGALKNRVR